MQGHMKTQPTPKEENAGAPAMDMQRGGSKRESVGPAPSFSSSPCRAARAGQTSGSLGRKWWHWPHLEKSSLQGG